jgi:glycosyltransferase involved in cell wall biosynthesis
MSARLGDLALRAVDLSLAAATVLAGALVLLARRAVRRPSMPSERPRVLVLDTAYSLQVLRARRSEHFITERDLDGYFEHVWNVHPLIGADPGHPVDAGVGPPAVERFADTHTMIEGKTRRFGSLSRLPYLNFALAQLQLVLMLDRLVHRERIGIVRGDPYYMGLLAMVVGRLSDRPVEVRVNGNHDAIYQTVGALAYPRIFRWRAVEQRVARYMLSRADSVVVYNGDNRRFALQNDAPPDRLTWLTVWRIVNPVHVEEPAARAPLPDEFGFGDRPVAVCVCRLERVKHPEDAVIAIAKARRRHPELAGVVVGEGAMRAELEELCAQLGVDGHVVLPGARDQPWIARMLTQSSVVVVPLAGLALVESALSETPIVAYDVEWHPEIIRPGEHGLLVPYRDTDAMADAICSLLEDRQLAARLGAAARIRAQEFMRAATLLDEERALADRLLAQSRAAARRQPALTP